VVDFTGIIGSLAATEIGSEAPGLWRDLSLTAKWRVGQ